MRTVFLKIHAILAATAPPIGTRSLCGFLQKEPISAIVLLCDIESSRGNLSPHLHLYLVCLRPGISPFPPCGQGQYASSHEQRVQMSKWAGRRSGISAKSPSTYIIRNSTELASAPMFINLIAEYTARFGGGFSSRQSVDGGLCYLFITRT
jgi:hypothetical protein